MRLMLGSLVLSGVASLALLFADSPDRWSAALDGQVMAEIRGADKDTMSYSADICAAQSLDPKSTADQTAADCKSANPPAPFGVCIDCGSQAELRFMSEVSSGLARTGDASCGIIVKKTGTCIKDQNGNFHCNDPQPDDSNSACSGTTPRYEDQVTSGPF